MALNKIKFPNNSVVEINDFRIQMSSVSDGQVLAYDAVSGKVKNVSLPIVTSISSLSTDTQVPSAKCMYDIIGNVETLLADLL